MNDREQARHKIAKTLEYVDFKSYGLVEYINGYVEEQLAQGKRVSDDDLNSRRHAYRAAYRAALSAVAECWGAIPKTWDLSNRKTRWPKTYDFRLPIWEV